MDVDGRSSVRFADALHFTLPYPPSITSILRAVVSTNQGKRTARILLSQDGRAYRRSVAAVISSLSHPSTSPGARLGVRPYVCPPDNRARNLSNLPKALEDALTHAHVWADASLIEGLRVTRGPVASGGPVDVVITSLTSLPFEGRIS